MDLGSTKSQKAELRIRWDGCARDISILPAAPAGPLQVSTKAAILNNLVNLITWAEIHPAFLL